VDGGKARIMLAALVTPAAITDNLPLLDLIRWVRFRWKLKPKLAVGDPKYGTIENMVGLETAGMRAYLPTPDFRNRTGLYPPEFFQYDAAQDRFRCPQGHELPLYPRNYREAIFVYQADAATCHACPVKPHCTQSKTGRRLRRSFYQAYLDRVERSRETPAYQKALRKRQVWVEPLFGEAKQWHQLVKFRRRGLAKVNSAGVMTAAAQNIKRLVSHQARPKPKAPAGGALRLPLFSFPQSWQAQEKCSFPCSGRLLQQADSLSVV
jgi:hypothetical protein